MSTENTTENYKVELKINAKNCEMGKNLPPLHSVQRKGIFLFNIDVHDLSCTVGDRWRTETQLSWTSQTVTVEIMEPLEDYKAKSCLPLGFIWGQNAPFLGLQNDLNKNITNAKRIKFRLCCNLGWANGILCICEACIIICAKNAGDRPSGGPRPRWVNVG